MTNKILARIPRKTITHLFRDKFPYKVETTYPAAKYVRSPMPNFGTYDAFATAWPMTSAQLLKAEFMANENARYRAAVDNFRRLCKRYVPKDDSVWKSHETQLSFHYYFLHKSDMEAFAIANHKRVRAIFEPSSESDIELMASEKNAIIRNSLFHDAYRYCVTFRPTSMSNAHVVEELDGWVKDMFGDDSRRHRYAPAGHVRKLYLNDEHDILLTQMAFRKMVSKVQKILLRSETDKKS